MFQDIQSAVIAEIDPDFEKQIQRISTAMCKSAVPIADYRIRIIYEAYTVTGIWVDVVWVLPAQAHEQKCIYARDNLCGVLKFPASQIEYLSRSDIDKLKRFLTNVRFEAAPVVGDWYAAQVDLAGR